MELIACGMAMVRCGGPLQNVNKYRHNRVANGPPAVVLFSAATGSEWSRFGDALYARDETYGNA
jgi:hypothetical protein